MVASMMPQSVDCHEMVLEPFWAALFLQQLATVGDSSVQVLEFMQVRGAYVSLERARAAKLGYDSPIWDNIQLTHDNYNKCLEAILDEVRSTLPAVCACILCSNTVACAAIKKIAESLCPAAANASMLPAT